MFFFSLFSSVQQEICVQYPFHNILLVDIEFSVLCRQQNVAISVLNVFFKSMTYNKTLIVNKTCISYWKPVGSDGNAFV